MTYGYDIVIDNMNLNPKEVEFFKNIVERWNNPTQIIPDRDSKRPNPIGEKVIRSTYEKYKQIIS